MGPMTQAAREPRHSPRPHLHLVAAPPVASTASPAGRWKVIGPPALAVFLGSVTAEGASAVAGLSFTQDLIITTVPVVGGIVTALAVELRRRSRSSQAEGVDAKLRAKLDAKDEELHEDLRRQIRRLEKQLDDMAREHVGPLRDE